MAQTLTQKLQIKSGQVGALINIPVDLLTLLTASDDIEIHTELTTAPYDFIFTFVQWCADLEIVAAQVIPALKPDGLLWFAYPKHRSSLETDLTRDDGWHAMNQAGWRGIRQIAVDSNWSAVRFRPAMPKADLIATQYAGAKADLKPIYDHFVELISTFGTDIDTQTRNTYVAFARKKQFCLIKPSTKTRVDIGLKLPGKETSQRLQVAKNLGSGSVTHKVALTKLADIDAELIAWLKEAYLGVG